MKYKSQTEAVLAHLQNHGSITSMQAFQLYGATRLSAIIFVLRRRGYRIITEPMRKQTRFGKTSHPAEYILFKENE